MKKNEENEDKKMNFLLKKSKVSIFPRDLDLSQFQIIEQFSKILFACKVITESLEFVGVTKIEPRQRVPVDTRRRFNVCKTSIRRQVRLSDVETMSCV